LKIYLRKIKDDVNIIEENNNKNLNKCCKKGISMNNEGMTSRERVIAGIKDDEYDRLPVINPTSVATLDSCKIAGVTFSEVHLNADKMAALAAVSHEKLGFDSVSPYFSVVQEAAALGCQIDWGAGDVMPNQKSSVYKDPDEFKMPKDLLDRLPLKTVNDAIRLLRKKFGDEVAIIGKVMGPWTLSYHLYGVENFLVDTVEEPERVHAFLDKFKDISLKFAEAQLDAGADIITWADHATADLVGAESYKEFLLPVHKMVNKRLKDKTLILHCCGNTADRIAYFSEAGFPVFHFDSKNDVSKAMASAGNMKLTGGLNNPEVLLKGTTEDVKNNVLQLLDKGIKLVSPECAIPVKVPNENLKAIGEAMI
jgi:[methyl-Co(III) methanol-specific corrinoid protein]:coenzyme M methyltransferase